jgi:hypothetical protein
MERKFYLATAIAVAAVTAACSSASPSSVAGPSENGRPNSGRSGTSGNASADQVAASCGISEQPGNPGAVVVGPVGPDGTTPTGGANGGTLEWTDGGDGPGLSTDGPVTGSQGVIIGPLDNLQGSCPSLKLTIGTTTVTTDVKTSFAGVSCQSIKRSDRIGAAGVNQADRTLAASCVTIF